MRSRAAGGGTAFVIDLAIADALVFSVAFFLIVMEFCIGNGEFTRAALLLPDDHPQLAHTAPATKPNNQHN